MSLRKPTAGADPHQDPKATESHDHREEQVHGSEYPGLLAAAAGAAAIENIGHTPRVRAYSPEAADSHEKQDGEDEVHGHAPCGEARNLTLRARRLQAPYSKPSRLCGGELSAVFACRGRT